METNATSVIVIIALHGCVDWGMNFVKEGSYGKRSEDK